MWIKSWITRDNLLNSVDKQGITVRYVMLPQGSSTPTSQTYPHIHIALKYSLIDFASKIRYTVETRNFRRDIAL